MAAEEGRLTICGRFRDLLRSVNPEVDVRGVIDAAGSPTREFIPWTGVFPQDGYQNYNQDLWNKYVTVWNHRGDASCMRFRSRRHRKVVAGDRQRRVLWRLPVAVIGFAGVRT